MKLLLKKKIKTLGPNPIAPVEYDNVDREDKSTQTPITSLPATFIPAPFGYQNSSPVGALKGFTKQALKFEKERTREGKPFWIVYTPHFEQESAVEGAKFDKNCFEAKVPDILNRITPNDEWGAHFGRTYVYFRKQFDERRNRWELELHSCTPDKYFNTPNHPDTKYLELGCGKKACVKGFVKTAQENIATTEEVDTQKDEDEKIKKNKDMYALLDNIGRYLTDDNIETAKQVGKLFKQQYPEEHVLFIEIDDAIRRAERRKSTEFRHTLKKEFQSAGLDQIPSVIKKWIALGPLVLQDIESGWMFDLLDLNVPKLTSINLSNNDFYDLYGASLSLGLMHSEMLPEAWRSRVEDMMISTVNPFAAKLLRITKAACCRELRHYLSAHVVYESGVNDEIERIENVIQKLQKKFGSVQTFENKLNELDLSWSEIVSLFGDGEWETDFGGEAWKQIAVEAQKLESMMPATLDNLGEVFVQIDHIIDMEHNTGLFLQGYVKTDNKYPQLTKLLNAKTKDWTPEIFKELSPKFYNLFKNMQRYQMAGIKKFTKTSALPEVVHQIQDFLKDHGMFGGPNFNRKLELEHEKEKKKKEEERLERLKKMYKERQTHAQVIPGSSLNTSLANPNQGLIDSPRIEIEPAIKAEIEDAVQMLQASNPSYFKGVSKIVALNSGPYGQVSSDDASVIHLNVNRIKNEIRAKLGGFNEGNPEHREAFEEAIKTALIEVIAHEKGHVLDWDPEQNKFPGGEGAAEREVHMIMPKFSDVKGFCKKAQTSCIEFKFQTLQRLEKKVNRLRKHLPQHEIEEYLDKIHAWEQCPSWAFGKILKPGSALEPSKKDLATFEDNLNRQLREVRNFKNIVNPTPNELKEIENLFGIEMAPEAFKEALKHFTKTAKDPGLPSHDKLWTAFMNVYWPKMRAQELKRIRAEGFVKDEDIDWVVIMADIWEDYTNKIIDKLFAKGLTEEQVEAFLQPLDDKFSENMENE